MKKIFFFLILILILLSCRKDKTKNPDAPIEKLEHLWKLPLYEGNVLGSRYNEPIYNNWIFKDQILLSIIGSDNKNYLSSRSIYDGLEKWRWDEKFFTETEGFSANGFYENNGLFTYSMGSRHYCINLNTGESVWKVKRDKSYSPVISGKNKKYYILGKQVDTVEVYKSQVVYKGNIETGGLQQYILPQFKFDTGGEDGLISSINQILPVSINGVEHYVITLSDPFPNWNYDAQLSLYNAETKDWEYYGELISNKSQGNGISDVVVYNNKIYLTAGSYMACHDLKTGKRIWRKNLKGSFLFSSFILRDDKIFTNNEGGSEGGHMYALDTETGDVLWKTQTGGTSSTLRYLNGIVYMSGGSSNRIHAIDGNTGKHVWKLDPKYLDNGISNFKWDLYAWEGDGVNKGRVVVCTGRYAYCFEAYQ